MTVPVLYIAITNHGFGHATRVASVAATIQHHCPELLIILVTTAPRWLLEAYFPGEFIHRPRALDVGVVQSDSLTMDKSATLDKLKDIRLRQKAIVQAEADFIQQNKVRLILADIPPLATAIARAAKIPCWMMSNFGWDFIYSAWGAEFAEITGWIQECFQQCDRLFRLPFHESMSAFPAITDVGLTGGTPRYSIQDLQSATGIKPLPLEKTVLLTFGGLGLDKIPYDNLDRFPDWQFITFDSQAPVAPNLIKVTDRRYRPVDFMPFCGRLVSKPGYSTFAEACRLGVPIASLTREDFAESALLLSGIQDHAFHQILQPAEFFEGDWGFLHTDPHPPRQVQSLLTNGNETIAQAVVNYFAP